MKWWMVECNRINSDEDWTEQFTNEEEAREFFREWKESAPHCRINALTLTVDDEVVERWTWEEEEEEDEE